MKGRERVVDDLFRVHLITLLESPHIGARRAIDLVEYFGSPQSVFSACEEEISRVVKLPPNRAREILQGFEKRRDEAQKRLETCQSRGIALRTYWDGEYFSRLKHIPDPPVLLYTIGNWSPLYDFAVAVVGTRAPSEYGTRSGFKIAAELAARGVTVVSGLAIGVDGKVHQGALSVGGKTIAVLGSGVDVVYPAYHKKLYHEIADKGLVVSELAPGTYPDPHHFPRRNRIISGISLGVVIVEAGLHSGALITARHALEQGRELFGVPGMAGQHQALGVNRLIKEGTAHLVETGDDIIEHLRSQLAPILNVAATLALPKMTQEEMIVYNLLEKGDLFIDDLVQASGMRAADLNRLITAMQLKGLIKTLPGARVTRV